MSGDRHHEHHHAHEAADGHGTAEGDAGQRPRWDASFWDERYGASPQIWSGHVNAVVASETAALTPGHALDVGCGEGGDVLWLAERGWTVLGVDVSGVALDRAAARAAETGLDARTRWERRDLMAWVPDEASFDLVTAAFLHLEPDDRRRVYGRLAAAVAPGGCLLVAAHSPLDIGVVPRPPYPDLFFTAEEIVADLAAWAGEWDVVVAEDRPRPGTHPDGHEVTLHDTVLRAVRRT